MNWKTFLHRLWTRVNKHDIFAGAAQLSYYFLLALFPLLLFLVTLFGYFATSGTDLRNNLLMYLAAVMPSSAIGLVHATLDEITQAAGSGKLSLGLLVALWAASNGMGAISDALNRAYGVEETRSWWKVRAVSILLTITLSILIVAALVIVFYGGHLGDRIAGAFGFGSAFTTFWKILQWPIAVIFLLLAFNLMYFFAPDVERRRYRWWTPGTLIGVALWLLFSFGFRLYLHFFNSYSVTYGSLGALIILMLWFYFTGIAILIGGEINSELDQRPTA